MNWANSDVSSIKSIRYDAAGNKRFESQVLDGGMGDTTLYSYQDGRLTSVEKYKLGKKGVFSKTVFEYNEAGRKTISTKTYGSGAQRQYTYEYHENGLLKRETWLTKEGEKAFSFETEYAYH